MLSRPILLVALAAAATLAMIMPAGAADPLADYLGRKRVLLVSAATADDPQLAAQRKVFVAMQDGAKERDLALVEAVGTGARAQALRAKFGVPATGFRVLLIGKDGGAKLTSEAPLGPDRLFPTIDAMPMRQDEMKRRP